MSRRGEVARLVGFLESGGDATGLRFAEVRGEPGIGKTTLLRELSSTLTERNWLVLAGRGGGRRRAAYGTLIDAVDEHFDLIHQTVEQCLPEHRAAFTALLDSGDRYAESVPEARESAIHRAFRRLLESLAPSRVVLILDEFHDADPATVELCAALLRHPPRAVVALVVGYRDRQASTLLQAALNDRSQSVQALSVRLDPLKPHDLNVLLGSRGTPQWRHALYRDSGGNPSYLQVLLSEQPDPGVGPGHVDWTQCEGDYGVLLSEVCDLQPPQRAVIDAAAVVGIEFDVELVGQLLELTPTEVLDVVSVLVGRDLIRSRIPGQLYGFRHPVLQRAVYRGCRLSSRLALHSRLEAIYRQRGASILERAPHVAQSAKYGDLDAVELLTGAVQLVTPTDLSAAVGWLSTALRLLPAEPAMQEWRARLLVRLAEAKGSAGYLRECRDIMHRALRILPPEPADAHAEAVAYTGMVHRLLGRSFETESMLTAELAALDGRPPAAGQLMLEIANVRLRGGDDAGSAEWARAALQIAIEHEDPSNAATALGLLAMSVALAGQLGLAAQHLQRAAAMLDRMLDDEFSHSLDAAIYISKAEMMLERWDDALRHQEKAVEFATRASLFLALPHLLLGQAHALQSTGRLVEAIAKIDEAVHLAQRSESPELLACVHAVRCSLYAARGKLDRVPESAAAAASYFRGNVRGWPGSFGARMLAEARLLNGDPEGCLALAPAVGAPELSAVEPVSRLAWYELLTRAELATGRIDEAARWAARATKEATVDLPGLQALASLARAQLSLARDPQAALTDAEHAVRHFRLAGMTAEVLRARVVLGTAMWHHRGYDEAARELRDTERRLEEAGALALARVARKERRRLAARGSRERGVDPHSITTCVLTSREQQVAELVGDGLTNRLIARRLNIAEKTVEMHMSKIFAKYGVASRAAVAAFVASRRAQEQAG